MTTTTRLLEAVQDIWEGYYRHPFVQGIRNGTLDEARFRYYIIQDYLYLIDYARLFALGAAKAPDVETMRLLAGHCSAILEQEMNIHEGYMGRLQITEEELQATPKALANASYTSYMLRVAYEEDAAAVCAAILACSVSYEVLARRMVQERPDCLADPLYGDWIAGYAAEDYARDNARLIDCTDRLTEKADPDRHRQLEEIFITCSRYETAFWDMGWERRA